MARAERTVITIKVVEDGLPATRAECVNGPRPCPFIRCEWHMAHVVTTRRNMGLRSVDGQLVANLPTEESCVMDVTDRGGVTLEEIATVSAISRERVRQIEEHGLRLLKIRKKKFAIDVDALHAVAQANVSE